MAHYERRPIDAVSVERETARQKDTVRYFAKRYRETTDDPHREQRLKKMQCVVCYGGGRIGGAACSSTNCGGCGETIHSGSTCLDVLCLACALRLQLCTHCGADIELKRRRKPRDFTPPEAK